MEKIDFALAVIILVAAIQALAWIMGFDGQVFAFTSLVIGAVVGSVMGFSIHLKPPSNMYLVQVF